MQFNLCKCFGISGFRNFGETYAWQHSGNLRCENIGRDCEFHYKFFVPAFLKMPGFDWYCALVVVISSVITILVILFSHFDIIVILAALLILVVVLWW